MSAAEGRRALSRPVRCGGAASVSFLSVRIRRATVSLATEYGSFCSLALDIELYSDSLHHVFSLESWRKARKKHVVTSTDHEGKLAIRYIAIRSQYTLMRIKETVIEV